MQVPVMVHYQPPMSMSASLSDSQTVPDEGSCFWYYRVYHSVSEIGIDGKQDGKNAKVKAGEGTEGGTLVKKEAEDTDEMYYLQWNPTGDYDSDDDWWNEVVALQRKGRRKNKKREKRIKKAAARVLQEAMYQRYKYHTGKVMKWGNALWADRHSGQNSESDQHFLSLRTVIGRLNSLALDGIAMPPIIYRHLEHAVELREEFQTRYRSGQKNQEERDPFRKASRKKDIGNPSMTLSLSQRNGYGRCSDDDVFDFDKKHRGNSDKTAIEIKASMTPKKSYEVRHKWILDQLKACLDRFQVEPSTKTYVPYIPSSKQDVDFGSVPEAEASCDSKSSNCKSNCTVPIEPRTALKYRMDKNSRRSNSDQNRAKRNRNIPIKPCSVDKYPLNGKYGRSNREKNCAGKDSTTDKNPCDNKRDTNNGKKNRDKIDRNILRKRRTINKNPSDNKGDRSNREKSCNKDSYKSLTRSHTASKYPSNEKEIIINKDGNSDKRVSKNINEFCAINNYSSDDKSGRSSHDDSFGQNYITATILPSRMPSISTSAPSTISSHNQCSDQNSTSESILDDWDEIFGDDGSLIEVHQNSDDDSDSRNLDIVMSVKRQSLQDEAETFFNSRKPNFRNRLEDNRTNPTAKEKMTQKDMLLNSAISKCDVVEVASLSNNSVRTDISSQSHNHFFTGESKTNNLQRGKDLSDDSNKQKTSPQTIGSQTNFEIIEISSTLKNLALMTSDDTNRQLVMHSRQYSSVWDVPLLEEEEATMLMNTIGIPVSIDKISLQSSNPPEDWEMLFEEEENEDKSVEETDKEVTQTLLSITKQEVEFQTVARQPTKLLRACKIDLFLNEKNSTENRHRNRKIAQHCPDQNAVKLTKPAYNVTENLRYDSVWDIFASEKTSSCTQVIGNNPITVSAITTDNTPKPEKDWEALYL